MPRRLLILVFAALLSAAALPAAASAAGVSSAVALVDATAAARGLVTTMGDCPTKVPLSAPAAEQEQAMLCLTNFARQQAGEPPLEASETLQQSASEKSNDIIECDSFSHTACGREFTYWIRASGYLAASCWRVGENLAWGAGEYGTVGSIFRAWMHSPEHRVNILGNYDEVGIDLRVGSLNGLSRVRVWTQHFGSHCEG